MNKTYTYLQNKFSFLFALKLVLGLFIVVITSPKLVAQTITIAPTADAFVRNGTYGNTNYGSDTSLIVKGSPNSGYTRLSYLKFSLGTIANVKSAKVRLYGFNKDNTSTINVDLFSVNDDSWTETGITFNNAPASSSSSLSSAGVNNVAGYYEFDITNFVKAQLIGDKIISVFVKDNNNQNLTISFNSKENISNAPQLVVDTTVVVPTITLTPTADAFVRNGTYGNTNYGTDTSLIVKGSPNSGYTRLSYLKFSLGTIVNVRSAKVRLYGLNKDNTSTINVALFGVNDDTWTETGITFNNAPASSSFSLNSTGVNNVAGYYEFDVTNFVKAQLTGDKVVSVFAKDSSNQNSTIVFNSKENISNAPQLVIDTTTVPLSNSLIFVENLDKFPSNDHFVFSHIQIPWTRDSVYNANHDSLKVRIHNNGINPLTISNLVISNDTLFKIDKLNGVTYNPLTQLPASVSSGGYLDLMVKFIAQNVASRAKVLNETLSITSNDDNYPVKKVYLDGLWQYSGESIHEPFAQEVLTTFGYKTKIGFGATDPDKGDSTKLKGNEIKPSYFLRADTSLPVTIRQLAAYHSCCHATEAFRWFYKGTTTYNTVFTHISVDGQTLLPRKSKSTGTGAGGTMIPTGAFGVIIGSKNTTDASKNPGGKLGVRVYKALDGSGNIIPDTYILNNDYLGTSGTNYDYNDNMYYVSNIKPFIGTVYYSPLNVTPSDLDFGEHVLQTTDSLQLNISSGGQIYSNGSQDPPLVISSVVITGENQSEFSAAMPIKTTLNPQESTTIKVKFNPASQGLKIADLLIYYNNSQSPKRVPLYGIAKATGVTVTANYRINSGASSPITFNGKTWAADNQYSFDNLQPYTNPALKQIAATDEDFLYLVEQSSNGDKLPFRYQFPVANGTYYVRLHFAEIFWGVPGSGSTGGVGSRVFNVKLENQYKLINYDLIQDVGGAAAVVKNFPVTVTDGNLNIDFSATINRPTVSAVEVYSFSSTVTNPVVTTAIERTLTIPAIDQKPRLYPNPVANKNFNIQFPGKYQGIYNLYLVDILGRTYNLGKTRLNAGGSNVQVDISKFFLKPGVYVLKINSSTNKADILKLLIE